ncbi:MAG: phage terminase large subunit family protein, partial [candidate division Zixibacteria bacterium]|nr:phage terminase large subunit family protein [candidate division Zixibacteria bacterium]
MSLSEWADQNRRLSPESSAEPGRWRTSRAPYLKGIMDALSDSTIERVVLMKSAQTGGTECSLNAIGYYIDQDPSPILVVQPTVEMGLALSKDRLAPMLRDTPVLKDRVTDVKSRDSGNTLLHKTFPGGHITITGANSPAGLAMRPVRVTIFDEVDRFPSSAGTEGDPVTLGRKRSKTFWNRKSFEISTPTVTGISRIEASYEMSDQRHFHVPCPECGTFQKLVWAQVKWDKDENKKALPETTRYECEHCAHRITDKDKHDMLINGEWVADNPDSAIAGFHINELYSPWSTFQEVVEAFLEAKPRPDTLRAWVNTSLGETWEESGDDIDHLSLFESLREVYEHNIPHGVVVLTAGVDIQKDRIEVELCGWGIGFESWAVEYQILYGDTTKAQV